MQPNSKPLCEQDIYVHSPANPIYHKSESELVDQFKEEQTDNTICFIGDVNYVDNSQNFDQFDDDVLQTETNLAEK